MERKDRAWISQHLDIGKELLYLTKKDCEDMNIPKEVIFDKVERALMQYSLGEVEMPAKIGVHPYDGTFYHAMPANLIGEKAVGVKWISGYNDNLKIFGLPSLTGLIIYNDYETGFPVAIMDCVYIVLMRTPAASFVSAKYMANPNSGSFGMIGCGAQGRHHIGIACNTLRHLREIYLYDVSERAMDQIIEEYQRTIPAKIIKTRSHEELVKNSEVIASATVLTMNPSSEIKDEWIGKGQTVLACDMHQNFEAKTMRRADKYLMDSIESQRKMEEYGFYPDGLPDIYGEIGEVIAGRKKGREHADELIVCNNIGLAAHDMTMAKLIFETALERGIGIKLPL